MEDGKMLNPKFRASQVGKIMAYPDKDTLPQGAISYLEECVSQQVLGWEESISTFAMEKGKLVEDDSIALFSSVIGDFFLKNVERITTDYLTGECDIIIPNDIVWDIKSSYSKKTHEMFINLKSNKLYFWQLVAYSELYNVPRAGLARCLVDTPIGLIDKRDEEDWHIVSHIEPYKRCSYGSMEVTAEWREQLNNRVKLAQAKFNEMLAEKM